MGLFNLKDASGSLEDLLDRERLAVLDGRFDVLERMTAEKERLLRSVALDGASAESLARLRRKTERNSQLLDAMRAGVVAAQDRLKAMQKKKDPLQTYDSTGRKSAIRGATHTPGRRA